MLNQKYQEFKNDMLQYQDFTEEELQEMWAAEMLIENFGEIDDPCYGCERFDASYNCKHCKHGDDGNYTLFDVYRMSELL